MKAMCIDESKNFVWQDVPEPECHGEFDVKLAVKACAVNRAEDILVAKANPTCAVAAHRCSHDSSFAPYGESLIMRINPRHEFIHDMRLIAIRRVDRRIKPPACLSAIGADENGSNSVGKFGKSQIGFNVSPV